MCQNDVIIIRDKSDAFSIFSLYNVYSWVIKKIYPTWHRQWHDNCYIIAIIIDQIISQGELCGSLVLSVGMILA